MNAAELRIGNWIYLFSKYKPYQIMNGHHIGEIQDAPMFFEAKPIPLTEEWLLRFGFEKFNHSVKEYWAINDFEIEIHCNKFPVRICGGESAPHLTQFIGHGTKYVHQLQNIYFALTGEELKIKE